MQRDLIKRVRWGSQHIVNTVDLATDRPASTAGERLYLKMIRAELYHVFEKIVWFFGRYVVMTDD
jgi:hypothetical protein